MIDQEEIKLIKNIAEHECRDIIKNWPMMYQYSFPWHYLFFHNFGWYHWLVGGLWQQHEVWPGYNVWFLMKRELPSPTRQKDYRNRLKWLKS